MNLNLEWKRDLTRKISRWWEIMAASLLAGSDALGVYMEENRLTLAQVRQNLSDIQLVTWTHFPIDFETMAELAHDVQEIVSDWGLESCPVSLAVSPHLGFFRRVSLPRAAAENLAKVVAYEMDRFLPFPADQLYYAFQILAETETEIHLMLMAVPRDRVEACLGLLRAATLRPVSVEPAPMAAGNVFALSGRPLPASWLLLHLEESAFELTNLQGGKIKELVQRRHLQGKELSQAILAQVDRLMAAGPAPKMLGVYGHSGADVKLGAIKKHELDVIYPHHTPIKGLTPEVGSEGALPALGAGLSCLGKSLEVNLLPPEGRARVRRGRFSVTTTLLLVFVSLAVLFGASAMLHKRIELYRINRQISGLTREAKEVEALLRESQALAKQMESLRKIGETPNKLVVLKNLTGLIPNNTWLINLRLSKQNVDLGGMSISASDLIPLLDTSGFLNKTEFASPIVTDANKFEHFKIKAEFKSLVPGP
jgi:Tfp pilus assembly protein PilN